MAERPNNPTPPGESDVQKIRNAMLALAAVATLGLGALVATTNSADARAASAAAAAAAAVAAWRHAHIGGGRHRWRATSAAACISATASVSVTHPPRARPSSALPPALVSPLPWRCRIHVRWPRPVSRRSGDCRHDLRGCSVAAAPRPCTCLTKEYTPDNLVVFKDVCTKEVASAPVGNTQVQLPMPPQQQEPARSSSSKLRARNPESQNPGFGRGFCSWLTLSFTCRPEAVAQRTHARQAPAHLSLRATPNICTTPAAEAQPLHRHQFVAGRGSRPLRDDLVARHAADADLFRGDDAQVRAVDESRQDALREAVALGRLRRLDGARRHHEVGLLGRAASCRSARM